MQRIILSRSQILLHPLVFVFKEGLEQQQNQNRSHAIEKASLIINGIHYHFVAHKASRRRTNSRLALEAQSTHGELLARSTKGHI